MDNSNRFFTSLQEEIRLSARINKPSIKELIEAQLAPQVEKEIDELNDIVGNLSLISLLTPKNLKDIEEWFKERGLEEECPMEFEYDRNKLQVAFNQLGRLEALEKRVKSTLIAMGPADQLITKLLLQRITSAKTVPEIAAIMLGNDGAMIYGLMMADIMKKKYMVPDTLLIQRANGILSNGYMTRSHQNSRRADCWLAHRRIEAPELARIFQDALKSYGLKDWKVELSPTRKIISVRYETPDGIPRIYIPEDRVVDGVDAVRLVKHEIECHVLDTMNAKAILHGLCKMDNDFLYEGRALYSDTQLEAKHHLFPKILINKAVLVLAIKDAMQEATFTQIAQNAYRQFYDCGYTRDDALDEAFKTAYRVLRGLQGPLSENRFGYAFPKDTAYLAGYYELAPLIRNGYTKYLQLGMSTEEDLVEVARNYQILADDLPFLLNGFSDDLEKAV